MVIVQTEPIDPSTLLHQFTAGVAAAGAVVSFTGLVRPAADGALVTALELQAYPGFTEKVMAGVLNEAKDRFEIIDAMVSHRYGNINPGEPIVFVAAASIHRREAFLAADFLMDQFKTRAPFWKKEHGPDGMRWIEPRDQDLRDLDRWALDKGKSQIARD